MKLKALATAELVRPMLEPLADQISFEFNGDPAVVFLPDLC